MIGSATPARAALAALCAAQFVLILDVAVVNVALVPLARDLDAAPGDLQLVASVYAATFGGLLLVAGRIADTGRRRTVFLAGLVLFGAASALCGAAGSVPVLVAGRALQGVGAALASPAALSLLTTVFREGPQRDRALGVWASVAAAGGAAGLLAGGALTATLGWRTVFLVNLPIIATAAVAGLRVLPGDDRTATGPVVRPTTAVSSCPPARATLRHRRSRPCCPPRRRPACRPAPTSPVPHRPPTAASPKEIRHDRRSVHRRRRSQRSRRSRRPVARCPLARRADRRSELVPRHRPGLPA